MEKKMIDIEELKKQVNELLDLKDTDAIDKANSICNELDKVSTERDDLIASKHDITQKYREAVMNGRLDAKGTPDEQGSALPAPKTWEQCIADYNAKKGN